jgi:hypothetical protein
MSRPEQFNRPKQVESIKGILMAALTIVAMYFGVQLAISSMWVMTSLVGVIGLAIYFIFLVHSLGGPKKPAILADFNLLLFLSSDPTEECIAART